MIRFKEFDRRVLLKSYVHYVAGALKAKITNSSRGGYHVRFALAGDMNKINNDFKSYGIYAEESNESVSGSYDTYLIKVIDTNKISNNRYKSLEVGDSILWVNNHIESNKSKGRIFKTKDLTPNKLGLGGFTGGYGDIHTIVSNNLVGVFDEDVTKSLIDILEKANTKTNKKDGSPVSISLPNKLNFSDGDLRTISKDYGEIIGGVWSLKNFNFNSLKFPIGETEGLIDLYGMKVSIPYPISVKSGDGSKVTVKNIISYIDNRIKLSAKDFSNEPAMEIFNIISNNSTAAGILELHKKFNTKPLKKLADIIGVHSVGALNIEIISKWLSERSNEEILVDLEPFYSINVYGRLKSSTVRTQDKMHFVISPLGESIYRILNSDNNIKKSLTYLANNITLMQLNVDVKKDKIVFVYNKFSDVEFEFNWAGYRAGNRIGYKAILKK